MSYRKASLKFGIPITTLYDKVHMKYEQGKTKPGPKTVLRQDQETQLKDWLLFTLRIGYGITRKEIANIAQSILEEGQKFHGEVY